MYAARTAPLWVVDGRPTPAALALLRKLQQADDYGLEPRDYDADGLAALAAQPSTAFDVDLSAAALKLVCDLHYGRIDPRAAGFDLGTPRPDDLDLARELAALATTRDIGSQLAAVEP